MLLKNKYIKRGIIILIVIALGGMALGAYVGGRVWTNKLPLEHDYDSIFDKGDYALDADENGLFKVLKINDTHFLNGRCTSDVKTLEGIKSVLDEHTFDLIIVNGDMIDGFGFDAKYDKENAIKTFATLLESYVTPWTFIPGNNDGEMDGDDRDVIAYMLRYPHFMAGNVRDIYGDMQFFVDINYGGELAHTIAMMDSGMRLPAVTGAYDHIRENQVDALNKVIEQKGVNVSLFFHMQTPAFEKAYQEGLQYESMPKRHSERYDTIPKNKTFDKMVENQSLIKLISVGHQHGNSLCALYNNRYYELASPSGYTAWRPEGVDPSVTAITIDVTQSTTEQIYSFQKLAV